MLIKAQTANVLPVRRLVKLWADRYTPDLSPLSSTQNPSVHEALVAAASPAGRAVTAAKLKATLVELNCQLAAVQARVLYEYISNVINLREARRLTQSALQIYMKMLELYQQPASGSNLATERLWAMIEDASVSPWGIPDIEELAKSLESGLVRFQKEHVASLDWRALGFVTTQLNFSNKLLLQQLTPVERVLINPYFKFIEEQSAVPWQRVCAAASQYEVDSPAFILVEQLLPASSEIAMTVYQQLSRRLPNHHSRRGELNNPDIAHSCLRDLTMFQAYLYLCVLEQSLVPIEKELVSLCVMVVESLQVKWELVEEWNRLLINEMMSRVTPEQKALLLPYTEGMQQAFYKKRARLGQTPQLA
jgi:hypothetical protein